MRLTALHAREFMSYPELYLDFSDISQVAIVGKNGHGKSAILDALLWCLYGEGRGSADEMVRDGASSCQVTTEWLRGDEEVMIMRSRSKETKAGESSLSVYIDHHNESKHTIAQTQVFIEQLMGMPARALLAGPVMVQGDSDVLLAATPAARKDILIQLLGLDVWERYLAETKIRLAEVDREQSRIQTQLDDLKESRRGDPSIEDLEGELALWEAEEASLTTSIASMQEEVATLRESAARLLERQERTLVLSRSLAEANARLDRATGDLRIADAAILEQESTLKLVVPEVSTALPTQDVLESLNDSILTHQRDLFAMSAKRDGVEELHEERSRRQATVAKARPCEGNPPHCRYAELHDQAAEGIARIDAQLEQINIATASLPVLQSNLATLNEQAVNERNRIEGQQRQRHDEERRRDQAIAARGAAEQVLAARQEQQAQLSAAIEEEQAAIAGMNAERIRLMQDEGAMNEIAARLTDLNTKTSHAGAQLTRLRQTIANQRRLLDEVRRSAIAIRDLTANRDALGPERNSLEILTRLFHRNGVPTTILQAAIPDIEERANRILSRLPDDYAIRLDTQVTTKSSTLKDTLDIVVLTADRERPYHMLSGGQRFRIDFAFRLGLAGFTAARHDATVDLLWLDEPLESLDPEGQEAVAEALDSVRDDYALTAVVTHVPDFNDRLASQLHVTMENGESTAQLTA